MKRIRLIALFLLLATSGGGCVQVNKYVVIVNNAPLTHTHVDGQWASDTDTDAKPALDLTIPLIP